MSRDESNENKPARPSQGEKSGTRTLGEATNPANKNENFSGQKTTTSTGPKGPVNKK